MDVHDSCSIEFTKEELDVLKKLVSNAPVQGTVQTLLPFMTIVAKIIEKLNTDEQRRPD